MESLGELLSILRKGKGLKQEDVAEELGVSAKTISSWENNRTYPDIMMLPIIADFYGITIDELVRGKRNNTLKDSEEEKHISDKSLLKIRKVKYSKYKQKCLIYSILLIISSLISVLGMYLSCFKALWTIVFLIIGVISLITFIILLIVNRINYLNGEGILTKDDYTIDKYPIILSTVIELIRPIILSFIPFFIYGLIIVLLYVFNNDVYKVKVLEIVIDYTKEAVMYGLISLIIGLTGVVIPYILYVVNNKKYANDIVKLKTKKNKKLFNILLSSVIGLNLLIYIIIILISPLIPIRDVVYDYPMYDSYNEFITEINTYTVWSSGLTNEGFKNGDKYVINFPLEFDSIYDSIEKGVYDCENNFYYVENQRYKYYDVVLYQNEYDELEDEYYLSHVKDLSDVLKNAYIYSDDRTNISINVSKSIGDISIPNEIFLHSYNSLYDYYQLELKEGLFYLDNNYVIEIEYLDDYRYADGLYYKPSTASLIEDWIRLYDTDLNLTAIRVESPLSFNSELDYKVVTFFSNTINYDCDLYIENTSILGVTKNRRSEIGYIKYGYNAGKYGHYEYTLYYLDDIVDQIICISFSISLLVSLTIGIILWKKEKYIIDFKNIEFKI